MAQELGASRRAALFGAALFVVNPVTLVRLGDRGARSTRSASCSCCSALRELWRDRPERAAVLAVIAALIKPQLAILVPIVAVVTIRRALWPTDPRRSRPTTCRRTPGSSTGSGRGSAGPAGPMRILTTGLAGLVTTFALSLPVRAVGHRDRDRAGWAPG